jgi:diguanylate cyclase (GGDEF)-like protein
MMEHQDDEVLLEMLHRRNAELQTLVQIGKTLTSTLDTAELSNLIIEKGNLLLKSRSWSLLLVDESSHELVFDVVVSDVAEDLKGLRLPIGQGIAGWVAENREPVLAPDVSVDPRFSGSIDRQVGFETSSIVCVPVQIQDNLIGVMQLINGPEDEPFTGNDLLLLSTIADYVAIGLSNARNFSRVRELVITDDLTGLYNARYFDELLEIELSRAQRFHSNLSVVFIDLDFFKLVNDKHGHLVGSRMLSEIGQLFKHRIRSVDYGARYGGDEFVLILPQTNKQGAYELVSTLRDKVRNFVLTTDTGTEVRVTASFGISNFPEDADNKTDLIRLADNLMYKVKETTRDGIMMAPSSTKE